MGNAPKSHVISANPLVIKAQAFLSVINAVVFEFLIFIFMRRGRCFILWIGGCVESEILTVLCRFD